MKLSKKWLQEFVFLPDSLPAEELAKELSLRTVEVEGVEKQSVPFEHMVVGVVESVEKHPNADKLKVCQVNIGNEVVQIVCGGSNVEPKMKVIVGKIGAKVQWHGQGELIELQKVTIRGVDSFGMICASDEIALSHIFPKKDEKEIVDISSTKVKPGTSIAEFLHLNDTVFEVDNKSLSNRPDLWGHYGMAREISALYRKKLHPYVVSEIKPGSEIKLDVRVEDKQLCSRYMAVAISGITIGPSSEKIQKRLQAVGIRPINNIVDITNYVMVELGQPTHAFDFEKLTSSNKQATIVIRKAQQGEKFTTLDGKDHSLTSQMLMITNGEKHLALAGIMGGQGSAVSDATTTIVFESAHFQGTNIRATSTALGLRTDSSVRFEKGLDPVGPKIALQRLVELTLQACPDAKVASPVVDVSNIKQEKRVIEISEEFLIKKLGVAVDQKRVMQILENLGFTVTIASKANKDKKKPLLVTVPSFRFKDVMTPEDLVEEIARIYGYENIPVSMPLFSITPPIENTLKTLERNIKEILALECGFTESYNYSFESPEWLKRLEMDTSLHLELENPIAKDRPLIRRSLIPNLLVNMESNLHRYEEIKLFETGRVYKIEGAGERVEPKSDELLPKQDVYLGMVLAKKGQKVPFFHMSSALDVVFKRLSIPYELRTENDGHGQTLLSFAHPGRRAFIFVNNAWVGTIAELHPHLQKNVGIDERVAFVQLNLCSLAQYSTQELKYTALSLFPSVKRDIAFVINCSTSHAQVVQALKHVDALITDVELFDVYEGEKLGKDRKSMAYHIIYSADRTLTSEEVDQVHAKVVQAVMKLGGEVRK